MELSENEKELRALLGEPEPGNKMTEDQKKELLNMIMQTELSMANIQNAGKTQVGGLGTLGKQDHLFWDKQPLSGK